jgi:hypothetical protein
MIDVEEAAPSLALPRCRRGGDRSVVRTFTFHSLPCESGGGLGRGQSFPQVLSEVPIQVPLKLLHQQLPPIS